jgi:hypothetical protein
MTIEKMNQTAKTKNVRLLVFAQCPCIASAFFEAIEFSPILRHMMALEFSQPWLLPRL